MPLNLGSRLTQQRLDQRCRRDIRLTECYREKLVSDLGHRMHSDPVGDVRLVSDQCPQP